MIKINREIKKRILLNRARYFKKRAEIKDKERVRDRIKDPSFEYRWFGSQFHDASLEWLNAGTNYFEAAELTLNQKSQKKRYTKSLSCYKHFFINKFELENIVGKDTNKIIKGISGESFDLRGHLLRLYKSSQQVKNDKLAEITFKILTNASNINIKGSLEDYITMVLPEPGKRIVTNPFKRLISIFS